MARGVIPASKLPLAFEEKRIRRNRTFSGQCKALGALGVLWHVNKPPVRGFIVRLATPLIYLPVTTSAHSFVRYTCVWHCCTKEIPIYLQLINSSSFCKIVISRYISSVPATIAENKIYEWKPIQNLMFIKLRSWNNSNTMTTTICNVLSRKYKEEGVV